MLLLNAAKTITVDGITVFPDHADPNQFWYLPGPIALARRRGDNAPMFTFIKYKPAAVAAGVKGGGFVMFDVNLHMSDAQVNRLRSRVAALAPGEPQLAMVPFD